MASRWQVATDVPINVRRSKFFRWNAGGGDRTHTPLSRPRILSPVRLPVSPPRREVHGTRSGGRREVWAGHHRQRLGARAVSAAGPTWPCRGLRRAVRGDDGARARGRRSLRSGNERFVRGALPAWSRSSNWRCRGQEPDVRGDRPVRAVGARGACTGSDAGVRRGTPVRAWGRR